MPDTKDPDEISSLNSLHEINTLLANTGDAANVMDEVLDLVNRYTRADRAYILLRKDKGQTYEVVAARHAGGGSASVGIVESSQFLIEQVMESGQTLSIEGLALDDRKPSILAAPMRANGQAMGVIIVDSFLRKAFSERDSKFLEAVSNQLAMAIDNDRLRQAITVASRSKNEYVSLVTHQLRVPLTSISGYSDMILSGMVGPLSERQEGFLQTIKRNADRMSELVSGLSDINRLETGRMKMDPIDFDIAILLDEVCTEFQESIKTRNQSILINVAPELPPVLADRKLIRRVLESLLTNASHYSWDGGSISISVQLDGSFALTNVSDYGIGISEEDQAQLFTPFFRSEEELVRQYTGWGLGLAVAKKIVEAQGGGLGFESQLGEGSTFFFTLPLVFGEPIDIL